MINGDYEVGFGKPPEEHQFKPGESGNKKGRPKGRKNLSTILNAVANQKITVKEDGKTRRMTKKEAAITQLANQSVKGHIKAIDLFTQLIKDGEIKEEERQKVISSLHTDDQAIINSFISRGNSSVTDI